MRLPLFGLGFYLAGGALTHILVLGATIDWSNLWTYVVVGFWPLVLAFAVIVFGLCVAVVIGALCGLYFAVTRLFQTERRYRARLDARIREKIRRRG